MLLKNFRSGTFRKQFQYLSFAPSSINQEWTWDDPTVNTMLEGANRWLGELNAFTKILPDVNLYIQMHTLKEANASSRIEGTQTRMETAAQPVAMVAPERRDDWQEVHNYTDAMDWAVGKLDELPSAPRQIERRELAVVSLLPLLVNRENPPHHPLCCHTRGAGRDQPIRRQSKIHAYLEACSRS